MIKYVNDSVTSPPIYFDGAERGLLDQLPAQAGA